MGALLLHTSTGTVAIGSLVTINKPKDTQNKAGTGSVALAREEAAPTFPPTRGAFRKGVLLSALLIVPGLSALLSTLASDPLALAMAYGEVFATVAVFAGLPSLLVFGGVGKNLARQTNRGRRSLMLRGAALGALADLSLALLASVPTATLPSNLLDGALALGSAAFLGGLTGSLLGLWIHYARSRGSDACAHGEA